MLWRVAALFIALLPARPVQRLVAPRLGAPLGFVAAALWVSAVTALLVWLLSLSDSIRFGPLGWRELGIGVGCGIVLFLLGAAGYVATERLLGIERPASATMLRSGSLGEIFLVTVSMTAVVAAEEIVFRGIALEALRETGPQAVAVLTTSALFAAYHLSSYQLASTLLYGLILAVLTLRVGGLWPALIAHWTLNCAGLVLSLATAGRPSVGG